MLQITKNVVAKYDHCTLTPSSFNLFSELIIYVFPLQQEIMFHGRIVTALFDSTPKYI